MLKIVIAAAALGVAVIGVGSFVAARAGDIPACYDSSVQKAPKCPVFNVGTYYTYKHKPGLRFFSRSPNAPDQLVVSAKLCADRPEYAKLCADQKPWKVGDVLTVHAGNSPLDGKRVKVEVGYEDCQSYRLGVSPCYSVRPLDDDGNDEANLYAMLPEELSR